jgi:hypothetical protein
MQINIMFASIEDLGLRSLDDCSDVIGNGLKGQAGQSEQNPLIKFNKILLRIDLGEC